MEQENNLHNRFASECGHAHMGFFHKKKMLPSASSVWNDLKMKWKGKKENSNLIIMFQYTAQNIWRRKSFFPWIDYKLTFIQWNWTNKRVAAVWWWWRHTNSIWKWILCLVTNKVHRFEWIIVLSSLVRALCERRSRYITHRHIFMAHLRVKNNTYTYIYINICWKKTTWQMANSE